MRLLRKHTLCCTLLTLFVLAWPLVAGEVTLGAGWRYQLDINDLGEKEKWFAGGFDRAAWSQVAVPKAWDLYDQALFGFEGIGWYTVTLDAALAKPGKLQTLHFGRVNYFTKVWLNGEPLGENVVGYVPFDFDVTGKLRADAPNVLVLRVDNRPRPEWPPFAKQIEWIQYGGVLEPLTLRTRDLMHAADVTVRAEPRGAGASVQCSVTLENRGAQAREVMLHAAIDGMPGTRQSVRSTLPAGATSVEKIDINVAAAKRWSPETPALYTLTVSVESGAQVLDKTSVRFGVRKVEARGREILLNGKAVQVRGVNRYDEYGGYGPNAPRQLVIEDLRQMKRAGVNFVRMHYPQAPELMSLYDEMGFLVSVELPINWWRGGPAEPVLKLAMPTLERIIRRDKNHPSVVFWSMANESDTSSETGIRVMRALLRRTKELDSSRLATFVVDSDAAGNRAFEDADLVAVNIYRGQFGDNVAHHIGELDELVRKPTEQALRKHMAAFPDKPIVVTEFGSRGVPGIHGDIDYTEDFQAAFIRSAWQAIRNVEGAAGGVLWCWADYYHRREFIQYAVFGPYGVVSVDRKPKAALHALAEMYGGTVDAPATAPRRKRP